LDRHDVIIVGLGAMGASAAYRLAGRGVRVLGIDRFDPPHTSGSSHGGTRITRLAIGEGVHYTPLVKRSHEIWREIERETGAELMTRTGGLMISSDSATASIHVPGFFRNTVSAAAKHGIAHALLDAAQIRARFPQFAVRDNEVAYFEEDAGFLRPEACVTAQLRLAAGQGAVLRTNETVRGFEQTDSGVTVTTDTASYSGARLIVAAGAWLPALLPDYAKLFKVYRQVQFWFAPHGAVDAYLPDRFPIFVWEPQGIGEALYGFPAIDGSYGGVKVASEQYAQTTAPGAEDRNVSEREIAAMHETSIAPYLPGLSARCVKAATCLYTVTPDAGFVIDTLPGAGRIVVVSACSGHGFKHSPAIGEILADMATDRRPPFDLSPFRLSRFA